MKVRYIGPSPEVVTTDGKGFPNGEPVEVSKDVAESLLTRSDFEAVKDGK